MGTSLRSTSRYEQLECFIPTLDAAPEIPHINHAWRKGIEAAMDLGCKVQVGNGNDFLVSHPLLFPQESHGTTIARGGVAVSSSRTTCSKALIVFLRRCLEQVQELTPAKAEPVEAPTETKPVPQEKPAVSENAVATNQAESPRLSLQLNNARHETDFNLLIGAVDRAMDHMEGVLFGFHYRNHTSETSTTPLSKCKESVCIRGQETLETLRTVRSKLSDATEVQSANKSLIKQREQLQADLDKYVHECLELETKIMVLTQTREDQTVKIETRGSFRTDQDRFMAAFKRRWHGSATGYTKISNALKIMDENHRGKDDWWNCYKTGQFDAWRLSIAKIPSSGGKHALVGQNVWHDFLHVCAEIRRLDLRGVA